MTLAIPFLLVRMVIAQQISLDGANHHNGKCGSLLIAAGMANKQLIGLKKVSVSSGGEAVFSNVNLNIHAGDRIALVGRNGAGKSTFAAMVAGTREIDSGERLVFGTVSIGFMSQLPDFRQFRTLGEFVEHHASLHQAQKAAAGLGFDPSIKVNGASGGELRRAAIAALLAGAPDLLILDEPTNHLDLRAILWLEGKLRSTHSAFLIISHDRAILKELTERTIWIDRGHVRQIDRGFEYYEDWQQQVFEQEAVSKKKLERTIRAETGWAAEGISARRKRNQRRLTELQRLRAERRAMHNQAKFGRIKIAEGHSVSKILIDTKGLTKSLGGQSLVENLSLRVCRGDRIALIGPNGCGKTTLINLLCGRLDPDKGFIKRSSNIKFTVFDQIHDSRHENLSVQEFLCGRGSHATDRMDQIAVGNSFRNITSYLSDFLFAGSQVESPIKSLSGGERARLELARLMAQPSNLMVLDEPTNDLDMETLDLLQELLANYHGAVLMVSHDREFLDRTATSIVAFAGAGKWIENIGGWSDHASQPVRTMDSSNPCRRTKKSRRKTGGDQSHQVQLTFTESYRLEEIERLIPVKESEIALLGQTISQMDTADHASLNATYQKMSTLQSQLDDLESEWLRLLEKKELAGIN